MPIRIGDGLMSLEIDGRGHCDRNRTTRRLAESHLLAAVLRPQLGDHRPDGYRTYGERSRQ
jgi:hypothetical protein